VRICYRGNMQPEVVPPARPWSTEWQVANTLEAMGHEVLRLQENAVGWEVVVDVASRCDLFLWTTTWNRDPEGAFAALKELRARCVPTAGLHLDLYFGTGRESQVHEHPFFRCEHVFTADGGHDAEFAAAGVNHHWSPPAIYAPDVETGTPDGMYACDVAFVGSYPYPHPEHAQERARLIRFCQSEWGGRFRLWRGGVRGRALADLYSTAKVVIGDSCLAGKVPRYWSDRIPETLGRAGFLLHPWVEGIDEHYTDGEHLRLFEAGDFGQVRGIVRHYLADEQERRTIARAGQAHVREHHTYDHRLRALIETVRRAPSAWSA
jgi:hypothetical protein